MTQLWCDWGTAPLENHLMTWVKSPQKAHILWRSDPTPGRLSEGHYQEEEENLPTAGGWVILSLTWPWFQNPSLGHASGTFLLRDGGNNGPRECVTPTDPA